MSMDYNQRDKADRHTLVASVILAGLVARLGTPRDAEDAVANATQLAAMLIQKIESIYE